jgi:hypothetical protein
MIGGISYLGICIESNRKPIVVLHTIYLGRRILIQQESALESCEPDSPMTNLIRRMMRIARDCIPAGIQCSAA